MKARNKQRNYAYFKTQNFLQEYCMGNMVRDTKAPEGSRYHDRRFYTPDQVRCGDLKSGGKLSLFDSSNPRDGQSLNMWKDWLTGESGDIYMLVMKNEGISTRYEAYDRLESLNGKAPENKQSRPPRTRYRNKTVREAKREGQFKKIEEHFKQEESKCLNRRMAIKEQLIQNLRETGAFFKTMENMPCQVKLNPDGSLTCRDMTCANYLKGMLLNEADPRYMCMTDIRSAGWKVRDGAKPEEFEYLVTKDAKYHLVTLRLYNAKDIEGIPAYEKDPKHSAEEITDKLTMMLKDNGVEMPNEALFKDPYENMKALRQLASENTWHDAIVPAQRALEREYAMTKLLQYAGITHPYKLKDCAAITEYLEHDLTAKILYKSAYRADVAAQKINGAYNQGEIKRIALKAREMKELMADPLQQLKVTTNMDYRMKDILIPKGAALQGNKAYDLLSSLVQEDRRLFESIDDPDYRKPVSFNVQFQDWKQDISFEQGMLQTGNKGTVTESLQYAALQPLREKAFDENMRQTAIEERLKLKLFTADDEFKMTYKKNSEAIKESEARRIVQEYQKAEADLMKKTVTLLQSESRYLAGHPAYRKIEHRVDTYLYHIPQHADVANEIDVRKKYGEMILAVKSPDFYGAKAEGLVVELKRPLVSDYQGNFIALGLESEPLPVKPFLKEIEQQNMKDFEQKFVVELETDKEKELYKGDEARQYLYAIMQDDRDMWIHEQGGTKPVEFSGWKKLNVVYDDIPVIKDKEYYDGQLKIGGYRFVSELINGETEIIDQKGENALKELQKGLRVLEKYTENQIQLETSREFEMPSKEEIAAVLNRGFEPEEMEAHRPKAFRKTSQCISWYEAKAAVNYCHTGREKTDYMVAELAKKYKADTIKRWFEKYLPTYNPYVKESLERPDIKKIIESQPKKQSIRKDSSKIMERQA